MLDKKFDELELTDEELDIVSGGSFMNLDFIEHTVTEGESLSSIASANGISTALLYAINVTTVGLDPDLIKPGQVLKIIKKANTGYFAVDLNIKDFKI